MTDDPASSPPPDPASASDSDSASDPAAESGVAALDRVLLALYPTVTIDGSTAVAELWPQPEHRGNPGWLQGGLAATVLDHVSARAGAAALGHPVVTGTLELRYRHPVALDGGPYRVEATAGSPRGRTVRVTAAIVDRAGRRLVDSKGLFVVRPALGG